MRTPRHPHAPRLQPRLRPLSARGVLLIASLMLLAAAGCTKSPSAKGTKPGSTSGHTPTPTPSSTGIPTADLSYQGVQPLDAQSRPTSNGPAGDAAKKAVQAIDTYYNTAFLQPSNWGGGSFPSLAGLFTPDAGASVAANLQALSLGPLASQITRVNPQVETGSKVQVLIESNGQPSYATVTTRFQATSVPAGSAAPVQILQSGQFMIETSDYKIAAYDVSTSFNGVSKSSSYTPPPGAGSGTT
ncbi:MAG: hypothetical protein ACRDJU_04935 [Actinomycetota bacterium]